MTHRIVTQLALPLVALGLLAGPALAQGSAQGLGSGLSAGGPGDRTGSITPSGQTKPPGTALGPENPRQKKLDDDSKVLDRQIKDGICKGCD